MASALIFPDLFFREVSKAARLPGCQAAGDFFCAYVTGLLPRLLGGLFFSWLDDKDGRKSVLVAIVLLMGGINLCVVGILLANIEVVTSPMPETCGSINLRHYLRSSSPVRTVV